MPAFKPARSVAAIGCAALALIVSCRAVAESSPPIRLAALTPPAMIGHVAREETAPTTPAPSAVPRAQDEPFGFSAFEGAGLLRKWRDVAPKLRAQAEIAARCRADAALCDAPARAFIAIVDAAATLDGRARLGAINRAVNLAIVPASDFVQHGAADVWSAPLATLAAGRGDCEDYAILKFAALRAAGVAAQDLRLVAVHDVLSGEDHAVAAARLDGRWLILDNRRFTLIDTAHSRYRPLAVLRSEEEEGSPSAAQAGMASAPSYAGNAPILL